jgi:hypothetical protein
LLPPTLPLLVAAATPINAPLGTAPWPLWVVVPARSGAGWLRVVRLDAADYTAGVPMPHCRARQVGYTQRHIVATAAAVVVQHEQQSPPITTTVPLLPLPTRSSLAAALRPATGEWPLEDTAARLLMHAQWLCEMALVARGRAPEHVPPGIVAAYATTVMDPLTRVLVLTQVVPRVPEAWPTTASEAMARGLVGTKLVRLDHMPGPALRTWIAAETTLVRALAATTAPNITQVVAHVTAAIIQHRADMGPDRVPWTAPFISGQPWALLRPDGLLQLHPRLALRFGHLPDAGLPATHVCERVWPWVHGRILTDLVHWTLGQPVPPVVLGNLGPVVEAVVRMAWQATVTPVHTRLAALVQGTGLAVAQPALVQALTVQHQQRTAPRAAGAPWQRPQWPGPARQQQHARLHAALTRLDDLVYDRSRLGVPPCMVAVLDKGRSAQHLIYNERRTMASWLVAMQPLMDGGGGANDSDIEEDAQVGGADDATLARFALGIAPDADVPRLPAKTRAVLAELQTTIRAARARRAADTTATSWGCAGIINASHQVTAGTVTCPYVAQHGTDRMACMRACSGAGALCTHPLDHVLRALDW